MASESPKADSPAGHAPEAVSDAALIRLLAAGREDDLERALANPDADPLVVDIVRADVLTRTLDIDLFDLQALRERATASPRSADLLPWVDAIIAGRQFLDGDIAGMVLAFTTLQALPEDPILPVPVLFARGRICRQIAIGYVLAGGAEADAECRRMRDRSVEDYLRCGFRGEAAVTVGIVAGLRAQMCGEEPAEGLGLIIDALATIGDANQTIWAPVLEGMRCGCAWHCGDFAMARDAIAAVERLPLKHPISTIWTSFYGTMMRLEETRDLSLLSEIDDAIARAAEISVRHPMLARQFATHLLADLGSPEARRYARPLYDSAFGVAADGSHEAALLRVRVDATDGTPLPAEEVLAHLQALADAGRDRWGAGHALRLARDADRVHQPELGDRLRRWAVAHLPKLRSEWTPWETRFSHRADPGESIGGGSMDSQAPSSAQTGSPPGAGSDASTGGLSASSPDPTPDPTSASPVVRIAVLCPALEVAVDGEPVVPQAAAATLLVALVASHPTPLHVEQVAELLWPGESIATARTRLNTLSYRLRRALGGAGLLRRTADLLALDPSTCEIDLLTFRAALRGEDVGRLDALRSVRGLLCDAELPYVDRLIDERRTLQSLWAGHASDLLSRDACELRDLADALGVVGVSAEELAAATS